jgi:hypothetical protein
LTANVPGISEQLLQERIQFSNVGEFNH